MRGAQLASALLWLPFRLATAAAIDQLSGLSSATVVDKFGDPRSKRTVGTQSEVPVITFAQDNKTLFVRGYQDYDLHAGTLERPKVRHHASKFEYIRSLLKGLVKDEHCSTMIDIGCSAGLISLIGKGAGFGSVHSLDHDGEYIAMLRRIVTWAHLDASIMPSEFSFGAPLPAAADLVICGALIHWVFCRTANFQNNFDRIFGYLFASVNPGKFLVVEWIDTGDSYMRGLMQNSNWWPERCFDNQTADGKKQISYSRANFESAALRHAVIVSKKAPQSRTRVFYVLRKHADRPAESALPPPSTA